jgi:hypothetical protein
MCSDWTFILDSLLNACSIFLLVDQGATMASLVLSFIPIGCAVCALGFTLSVYNHHVIQQANQAQDSI